MVAETSGCKMGLAFPRPVCRKCKLNESDPPSCYDLRLLAAASSSGDDAGALGRHGLQRGRGEASSVGRAKARTVESGIAPAFVFSFSFWLPFLFCPLSVYA